MNIIKKFTMLKNIFFLIIFHNVSASQQNNSIIMNGSRSNAIPKQLFQVVVPPGLNLQEPKPSLPNISWSQLSSIPTTTELPIYSTSQNILIDSTTRQSSLIDYCLNLRGQFPSGYCNTFVNCWDGSVTEQHCPEGLFFNPKGFCDLPQNVNCQKNIKTPSSSTPSVLPSKPNFVTTSQLILPSLNPTESPTIVSLINYDLKNKCLKTRGLFPSNSCDKFVNCWEGGVIEQTCPQGLHFSPEGYCDFPHKVNCQHEKTQEYIKAHSECILDFGTFRDRNNCRKFHTCIAGNIVATYECPQGFSFSDVLGVCDYATRVDCSKEIFIWNPQLNFFKNIPQDFMNKIDRCIPGTVLRLNPQCTTACRCRNGLSEIIQCPAGLAYDSKTDKCLPIYIAKWYGILKENSIYLKF